MAVFVAGVLVGYIIDGVIIYASGHSVGEWTAIALDYYFSNQYLFDSGELSSIHISSDGTIHGGGGGDFR